MSTDSRWRRVQREWVVTARSLRVMATWTCGSHWWWRIRTAIASTWFSVLALSAAAETTASEAAPEDEVEDGQDLTMSAFILVPDKAQHDSDNR